MKNGNNMSKPEAIIHFCECLRTEGINQINDVEFEQGLRDFIIDNCFVVRGFAKDIESNSLRGGVNYTHKKIDGREIPNVTRKGSTYILNSGNSTYMGTNTNGASSTNNGNQSSFNAQQTYSAPRSSQSSSANTYNQGQSSQQTQAFSDNTDNDQFLSYMYHDVIGTLILLSFIVNILRVVFTDLALSTPQFWALPIGLIVTREVLFWLISKL